MKRREFWCEAKGKDQDGMTCGHGERERERERRERRGEDPGCAPPFCGIAGWGQR
jgi:hypothetical protein